MKYQVVSRHAECVEKMLDLIIIYFDNILHLRVIY